MKLYSMFFLFIGISAHANCVLNTDDVADTILKNDDLIWEYLQNNPSCQTTPMHLSWAFGAPSKDIQVIPFVYQVDPGHHGIVNSLISLCAKNVNTGATHCKKGLEFN